MISVQDLTFTYPSTQIPVLHGLSFTIEKGEIVGFLGPSGAGKTTTQKVLIGVLKKYGGVVSVFGKELRSYSTDYYERIGVAFEYPNFYMKLTGLENLRFFQSLYKRATENPEAMFQRIGLADALHKPVSQYSKGMRMRLNFCRALLHNPDLLFLDEPTSGLDPMHAHKLKEWILEKKEQGTTIFITTHNMHAAEDLCDRVAFVVDGAIVLMDSPKQLKIMHGSRTVRVEYVEQDTCQIQEFKLDGLGENEHFIRLLKEKPIQTLHSQEATLEDIFIKTTGTQLV